MPKSRGHAAKNASGPLDVRTCLDALWHLPIVQKTMRDCQPHQPVLWEGAWLHALAPLVAAAASSHRPQLVIVPHASDAEAVARDLEFFLGRSIELFPAGTDDVDLESLLQQEVLQRLQVVSRLHRNSQSPDPDSSPVIVTHLVAMLQSVPSPEQLRQDRRQLQVGQRCEPSDLRKWLVESGYHSTTSVQIPGEFTVRGGILDIFPPDATEPLRIEWFDDEIESIRSFDVATQRSIERVQSLDLIAAGEAIAEQGSLLDYLDPSALVWLFEPTGILYAANAFLARVPFPTRFAEPTVLLDRIRSACSIELMALAPAESPHPAIKIPIGDVQRAGGDLEHLAKAVDAIAEPNRRVLLVCVNEGEVERMRDLLAESQVAQTHRLEIMMGGLANGFEIPPDGPIVLTVNQLLRRAQLRRTSRKVPSRAIDSFLDLREGDLIVHLSHGIGVYRGMQLIDKQGIQQEHLELEFAEGTKLFVPTSKIDLVQRYVGGTKSKPRLAKIGSQSWTKQKKAAEEAVTDMAADLLELQARRKEHAGIPFSPDTVWQHQFDASFPYEETPDQLTAIASIKKDMLVARPMDRLICGDVGFGKTEVAMRAAFKAIDSGYQVAVLVPTTVLAEQHFKTFRERMAEFPFDIERLSRFRTGAEQKATLEKLAKGQIDIIIGTHRLASSDVQFYNLGLVIVDEEQRFGVSVKEKLKLQRPNVDVLTLSATPIPRTLHMSLLGVRDISNLETAPEERLAVETRVIRFDENLIRNAILRELNRDGQIYFVHNRILDIEVLAKRLQRIVPEARIVIGHGQMNEHKLEKVMVDFIDHKYDILLSTTIIESGLDIPNANTIFIDEADRYGLSELHQLRGRVGRYRHQAHCYLLVDRNKHLTSDAARRLHAIEEYSQIGAGFGIAMRDLEIRGAGNLLGTQQSGHIAAIGYELYCQLLESAVRNLTHQAPKLTIDVELNLPIEAFIPSNYVPEIRHKIDLYRRICRIDSIDQLSDLRKEMIDRFGEPPIVVRRLLEVAELRIDAALWLIKYVGIDENFLVVHYADRTRIEQLARQHRGKLKVLDRQQAYWPIPEFDPDYLAELQSLLQPKQ